MPKKKNFGGKTTWSRRNEANNEAGTSFEADNRVTLDYGDIEYEGDETSNQDEFIIINDLRQKLSRKCLGPSDLRHILGKQEQMDDGKVSSKRERSESPTPNTSNKELLKVEITKSNKNDLIVRSSFTEEGEIKDSSSDDEMAHNRNRAWKFNSTDRLQNNVRNKYACSTSDMHASKTEPVQQTKIIVEPNREENSKRNKIKEIYTREELSSQEKKPHLRNKKSQNEDSRNSNNLIPRRKMKRNDQNSKRALSRRIGDRQDSEKHRRDHDHERQNKVRHREIPKSDQHSKRALSRSREDRQDSAKRRRNHDHERENKKQCSFTRPSKDPERHSSPIRNMYDSISSKCGSQTEKLSNRGQTVDFMSVEKKYKCGTSDHDMHIREPGPQTWIATASHRDKSSGRQENEKVHIGEELSSQDKISYKRKKNSQNPRNEKSFSRSRKGIHERRHQNDHNRGNEEQHSCIRSDSRRRKDTHVSVKRKHDHTRRNKEQHSFTRTDRNKERHNSPSRRTIHDTVQRETPKDQRKEWQDRQNTDKTPRHEVNNKSGDKSQTDHRGRSNDLRRCKSGDSIFKLNVGSNNKSRDIRPRYTSGCARSGILLIRRLKEQEDAGQIIHTLTWRKREFVKVLNECELDCCLIADIICVLYKIIQTEILKDFLSDILHDVWQSPFIDKHLPGLFVLSEMDNDTLKHVLFLFKYMLTISPESARKIFIPLQTIKGISHCNLNGDTQNLLCEVDVLCQESMKDHENRCSQISHFKYVSVMPTHQDFLCKNSHLELEPIRREGKYKDITHLLEVNFNLLRADFIQPLKDGIEDYRERISSYSSLKHVDNVKIYQDVHIIGPRCTFNTVAHTIRFDVSRFRNMRWESSKRLMNGSLLCLSNANFETKYFAVVISRNPYDLSNGIVDVQFDDKLPHELVKLEGSFTMVESEAYFEAYKHILKGLQNHNEMPFTDYIVSCDTIVKAPKYLFDNQRVSFSIMLTSCNPPEHDVELETENNERRYYSDTDNSERYIQRHNKRPSTNVHPLVENTWPTKFSLGLDDSQYKAMRFAITKEFALIQGPPGTGKTFIGLKIIEYFLQNQKIIYSFEGDMKRKPILVVCYTNHALDQFLEGIVNLNVVDDIIRVGGGCKNPTISELAIREKRRNFKKFSAELFQLSKQISQEKDEIRQFLTESYAEMAIFFKGVVHEEVLKGVMGKHYYDIREYCYPREFVNSKIFKDFIQPFCSPHLDHFNLLEWLLNDDPTVRQISQHDSKRKEYEREKYASVEEYDAEWFHRRLEIYEDDDDSMQDRIHSQVENHSIALLFPNQNTSIPKWFKKYKDIVLSSDILTKTEFDEIKNVWTLKSEKRWKLYNYWVKMFKIKLQEEVQEKEIQYSKICAKLQELLNEKDKVLMKNASVVGLTTTGFAKYQNILQDVQPKIVIIEEAAEILEAHILTTLTKECEHLILIGDHKQLRPKTASDKIGEKFNLKISLFERMILNRLPHVTLQKQHRMRPEISLYMKHIYKTIEDHPVVLESDSVKGVKHNVSFIRHAEVEDEDIDLMSKSNDHEARMVTAMFKYFVQQGYAERRITILTPYKGQVLKLRNYLPRKSHPELRIVAIDNFQGEENDIILLSLVRSNSNGRIGFLGDENRICVSLSRAKIGLYVIGNFKMLTAHSGLWKRIIYSAYCNDNYKDGFEVLCQNHPEEGKILRSSKDFEECVPKGGCNKPCQFRLPCGHSCKMKCHPFDREHTSYQCVQVCGQKTCEKGHICRNPCHINYPCGPCPEVLDKEIQGCGHIQKMQCYLEPTRELCEHTCSEILSCGHPCRKRCGETHTKKCLEKVNKTLLCGHIVEGSCYEEVKDMKCVEKCTEILKCGHPCVGTCGECLQGRLHKSCQSLCNRILVCGHRCRAMCCIACPPCGELCEYVCSHSHCGVACGIPCFPCREQCKWSCQHIHCDLKCTEICTRDRCHEPCNKVLECGHVCIGMCGEKCPKICSICNVEDFKEIKEIFFGYEDHINARFIELNECGHIFEVCGLDYYIDHGDEANESEVSIKPKTCPKCKTPIRKTHRYHNVINKMMADVNKVKSKIWGNTQEIEKMECRLESNVDTLPYVERGIVLNILHQMKTKSRKLSKSMVIYLTNLVNILQQIRNKEKIILQKFKDHISDDNNVKYLIFQLKALQWWGAVYRENMNDDESDQLQIEFQRLDLFVKCTELQVKYSAEHLSQKLEDEMRRKFDDLLLTLCKGNPLQDKDLREGKQLLKDVHVKITGLGISDEERMEIVKAMDLRKGAWYKCPNGHVYCISHCGGAMQTSNCPECREAIGGSNHALLSSNQHAREMDGSRHAAWSEEANMMNYDLGEFL